MVKSKAIGAGLELFLPRHCVVCGATGCRSGLCSLCQRAVGLHLARPALVPGLENIQVLAAGEYTGAVSRCILSYKEQMRTDLTDILASALARCLVQLVDPGDGVLVLPVPSSLQSIGRRGFSPAEHLASRALKIVERRYRYPPASLQLTSNLRRRVRRRQRAQKQLGRGARARQMTQLLYLSRPEEIEGRFCILVDDVITTGASLQEAQRVVTEAGGIPLGCVTLAWVRRLNRAERSVG